MRIVFLSSSFWPPDFGGELLVSIERLQSLAARGHKITVLTSGRAGYASRQSDGGLEILRSPAIDNSRPGRLLRRVVFVFWAIPRLFRLAPDVVHYGSLPGIGPATSAISGWLFSLAARLHRARTITVHSLADSESSVFETQGWRGFWQKKFLAAVDHIVAVSPALYDGLTPLFPAKISMVPCGIRDDVFRRVSLIPYGIGDDIFTHCQDARRQALRAANGAKTQDVIFLFLGSVGRRKGFDVLAHAFAELAGDHPGWRLWVIGPHTRLENQNIDEKEVGEVTEPLKRVGGQVRFWGRLDDRVLLSQILSAGDVFVFPSRKEGMGIAPLEAMAVGIPVIVSRIPGITDLANIEGETGFYVPPGDLPALKSAMLALGTDEKLRIRMGERAAQVVRQGFAWDEHVATWERLYQGGIVGGLKLKPGTASTLIRS